MKNNTIYIKRVVYSSTDRRRFLYEKLYVFLALSITYIFSKCNRNHSLTYRKQEGLNVFRVLGESRENMKSLSVCCQLKVYRINNKPSILFDSVHKLFLML